MSQSVTASSKGVAGFVRNGTSPGLSGHTVESVYNAIDVRNAVDVYNNARNASASHNAVDTNIAGNASVAHNAVDAYHNAGNGSDVYISGYHHGDLLEYSDYYTGRGEMELDGEYIVDYGKYRTVLENCNTTISTTPYPADGGLYCNATWDSMQCWGYAKAGTTVFQSCPAYITLSNPMAFSKNTCNANGEWFRHPETGRTWTNYSMCYDHSLVEDHKRVLYMYYYGFSISIVLLVISIFIFSYFRQLKCVRVTLHKHLFSSYVLTGALWIMYYRLVPMDSDALLHNPIWCQVLHVLTHYFTVCNYAWMFCEGFYLHAIIVITFTRDKKLLLICYTIGWALPILPILIYASIRGVDSVDSTRCWTGDSSLNWILAGPINASLIINFIFSINIMRILLSKLRSVHTNETMQTRRAVRATLILIPLLGLQYIAFPFKPPPGSSGEYIYSMVIAFLVSFQGAFVSLVFCFFNGEVVKLFKKKWRRRSMKHMALHSGTRRTRLSSMRHSEKESEGMLGNTSKDAALTNNNDDMRTIPRALEMSPMTSPTVQNDSLLQNGTVTVTDGVQTTDI